MIDHQKGKVKIKAWAPGLTLTLTLTLSSLLFNQHAMMNSSQILSRTILLFHIVVMSFILTLGYSTMDGNIDRVGNKLSYPKRFHSSAVRRGVILGTAVPAALAVGALLIEGYARIPQRFVFPSEPTLIANIPQDQDIVIIFPGAG